MIRIILEAFFIYLVLNGGSCQYYYSTSKPVEVLALSSDCGGQLNSSSGVIVSPGYPSGYPMNVTCAWTITTASSKVIDIRFHQFDTKYTSNGCTTDYVKVYDGSSSSASLLATVCGKLDKSELASRLIRSSSNKMYVVFRSDTDLVRPGFIAKFWTHVCPVNMFGTESCDKSCPCVMGNTQVCATFKGTCTCKTGYVGKYCSEGVCVSTSCQYQCRVTSLNPRNEECYCLDTQKTRIESGVLYCDKSHPCQTVITDTGAITNPSYPSPYRTNGLCWYTFSAPTGKLVFLRIYDINIEDCPGCGCDSLTIYDGPDTTSPVLGKLCGLGDMSDIPGQLWSTSNTMYIMFTTDSQNTYRGYYASITFISSDCPSFTWGVTTECTTPCICVQANSISCIRMTGVCVCKSGYYGSDCSSTNPNTAPNIPPCSTNIAATSGILSSPNYPQNYSNNQLCQWNIVSGTNKFIVFIVTDLRMESSPDCSKDYLDIYDGVDAYSDKLGRVCQGPVPSYTSSGNKMYIVMRTDGAGTNAGFTGKFISIDCPAFRYGTSCSKPCTCKTATTESCDSTTGACKCQTGWTSSDCSQDVNECLTIRCPRPQACLNTLGGYECSFSIGTVCNMSSTYESGYITNPSYPASYKLKAYCQWIVRTGKGRIISLSFRDFNVMYSPRCATDSINIYDGKTDSSRLIGRYCGNVVSGLVRSTGPYVYVTYTSPGNVNGNFFNIYFRSHVCKQFTYGPTCELSCSCDQTNTEFCDNTSGLCVCNTGWVGDNCTQKI